MFSDFHWCSFCSSLLWKHLVPQRIWGCRATFKVGSVESWKIISQNLKADIEVNDTWGLGSKDLLSSKWVFPDQTPSWKICCLLRLLAQMAELYKQSEVLSISQSDIFKAAHISSVISSWNPPLPGLLPFLFRAWLPLPVNMFGSCVSCIQFQWYIITQYASPSWWNECMFASMTTSDYTRNVDCSGGVLIVRVVCFLIPPWNVIWSDQSYTWNTW